MKITPLYANVIVKLIDDTNRTASGLYIPDVARAGVFARGEVLAAGSGRVAMDGQTFPLTVKTNDVVLLSRSAAQVIPWDPFPDGTVVVVPENNIIGVLTELERGTGVIGTDGVEVTVPVSPS